LSVAGERVSHQLDRHSTVKNTVNRQPHRSHTPCPQPTLQLIPAVREPSIRRELHFGFAGFGGVGFGGFGGVGFGGVGFGGFDLDSGCGVGCACMDGVGVGVGAGGEATTGTMSTGIRARAWTIATRKLRRSTEGISPAWLSTKRETASRAALARARE
jgi:hypothetical protein